MGRHQNTMVRASFNSLPAFKEQYNLKLKRKKKTTSSNSPDRSFKNKYPPE